MARPRGNVAAGLLIAFFMAVQGGWMIVAPDRFTGSTYDVIFDVAPCRLWGAGFLLAAVAYAIGRRPVAALPMASVSAAFAATIAAGVVQGEASSPTGWVWPSCVACLLLLAGYRGGR